MAGWSNERGRQDAAQSPLRALVAGFPGAAAHISGQSIWLNRFAEDIVGFPTEDVQTLDDWGDAVHREHEPEERLVYLAARDAGFPEPVVVTIYRSDGTPRFVEFRAYTGDDEEVWVMQDVTEARRAQQELRDREQRLNVAVATAGLGTWEWDVASGTLSGDASTRRLFGLGDHAGADTYAAYLDRVIADDRQQTEDAIALAVARRSKFDVELRVKAGHGRSRWIRMHGTVIDDAADGDTRLIGAVRDIDSYKRLDERLVHAARMESLGHLAGGVAHDFNNLLAVIQGQVEFVEREPRLSDKATVRLQSIERAVAKGAELVSALMQLGRSSSSAGVEVVNVNDVIEATASSLERIVGEDVTIKLSLQASEPYVRFDEARLSAIVLNLATNARDAMPVGGLLSIRTGNPPATARTPQTDGTIWLHLVVEDTGIGMDAATRSRIFEPFFTTKAPGVGTGLGLASVYDAVMDAGGAIDVDSTPGSGTTFVVLLPCTQPADAASDDAAPSPRRISQGQTVMVVEDDAAILEVTAEILRGAGYRVVEANGPDEALAHVAAGEHPDLLLTDVVMPGLSGPRLAAQLSAQIPSLPVLFMSGYTSEGHGDIPMDDAQLVRKPFGHRQLLERVAELLANHAARLRG